MIALDIKYFGNREYIDVSTLSTALYKALPDLTIQHQIRNFDIKLLKKVEKHCVLAHFEVQGELVIDRELKNKSAVIFNWEHQGKKWVGYFVETEKTIVERIPEPVEDPKDYQTFANHEVVIKTPINDDGIYNLMKMGRLIVVKNYNLFPRVVRFHFDFIPGLKELQGVVMKSSPFVGEGFYKLETFKDDKKFGEIIVKGLSDWNLIHDNKK